MFSERTCCPVCKHPAGSVFYSSPYSQNLVKSAVYQHYDLAGRLDDEAWEQMVKDAVFDLASCENCKCIYQVNVPSDDLLETVYSEFIRETNTTPFIEYTHNISEAMKLTSLMLRLLGLDDPEKLKILDYGMGWGRFALGMKACGCDVYGFELGSGPQENAEKKGIKMLAYDDIGKMKFDFINTEQVVEHLPQPFETTQYFADSLNSGGALKISVPFSKWLEAGDLTIDWSAEPYGKNSPMFVFPMVHLNYFRRPSLNILAEHLGLKQVSIPIVDELAFALKWTNPRQAIRNLGRAFFMNRVRNYYIFQKP